MARLNLPDADAVRALVSEAGLLSVHVTPNARHTEVALPGEGAPPVLQIRTTATPEGGKANREVIALVASALGLAKSRVELVRGGTGRDKVLKVD